MKKAFLAFVSATTFAGYAASAQDTDGKTPTSTGNFFAGKAQATRIDRAVGPLVLPSPDEIVIDDFTVPVGGIRLDESLAARLHRRHSQDVDSTPAILRQHLQTAFSDGLKKELKRLNLRANSSNGGDSRAHSSKLIIDGEFFAIDEGNQSKRMMIGFGRGASDIKAHVTISLMTDGQSTVVLDFDMDSQSNKMPGALATGTASLGAGTALSAVTDRTSRIETDAARMGRLVAEQIEGLMKEQKWTYIGAEV